MSASWLTSRLRGYAANAELQNDQRQTLSLSHSAAAGAGAASPPLIRTLKNDARSRSSSREKPR